MEVLRYNQEKVEYEAEMVQMPESSFIPMLGYFDAFRSLNALLTLIRLLA